MHIIFGNTNPSQKFTVRLRKKEDFYYSASNYNMMVADDADVSLGRFIYALQASWTARCLDAPIRFLESEPERAARLTSCCDECRLPCALFQDPKAQPPPDASISEIVEAMLWPRGSVEPARQCLVIQRLQEFMDTPEEVKFYDLYLSHALDKAYPQAQRVMQRYYDGSWIAERKGKAEFGDNEWHNFLHHERMDTLTLPALVPQVVLNFLVTTDLPGDHPDKRFFDSNVGRVDFFFLDHAGKHIIEIDGPYHHQSEEQYTRVLRRDRTLRTLEYHVHRFSNMEVRQAKDFQAFAWELFF